jgi:hypothetical protein
VPTDVRYAKDTSKIWRPVCHSKVKRAGPGDSKEVDIKLQTESALDRRAQEYNIKSLLEER